METITPIPGSTKMLLGEGPHWMEKDQALLYVNIHGGSFYRFFTETKRMQELKPVDIGKGSFTSLIIPIEGAEDEFVIAIGKTLAWINWSKSDPDFCTRKPVPICSVDEGQNNRFNDGKCDPAGRLWAGTVAYRNALAVLPLEKGSLYRIDSNLSTTIHASKLSIANGLAWSGDKKKFYYIDSLAYSVDVFDYDHTSGLIENRRVLLDYKKEGLTDEIPDGMCIDSTGNLWVACYRGSKIICVDPVAAKIIRKIDMPSKNITSCCWGGKDYNILYATSAHFGLPEEEFQVRPETGKTFAITGLGVKGLPPTDFKMDKDQLEILRKQR